MPINIQNRQSLFLFVFEIVVVDFDGEDYDGRGGGNQVGKEQRQVVDEYALHGEECTAKSHEQECRQGYSVSVTCLDCVYRLWHIAQNHAYRCNVSDNV